VTFLLDTIVIRALVRFVHWRYEGFDAGGRSFISLALVVIRE
jgi:hypothetical protein